MVPASFDFWRANVNRDGDDSRPTVETFSRSTAYGMSEADAVAEIHNTVAEPAFVE
jgi:hypothetical protein